MLQAITTDYEMSVRTAPLSAENVQKTPETEILKKAQGSQNGRKDSVEISEQARAAMQQADTVASTGDKAAAAYSKREELQAVSDREKKLTLKKQQSEEKPRSGHYANLSAYSEAELDKLVSDGIITKFQEQAEIAKRAAKKQEKENSATKKTQKAGSYQQAIDSYKARQKKEIFYAAIGKYFNRVA